MKVSGPSGPSTAGSARPTSSPAAAGGFEPIMSPAASGAAGVSGAGAVSSISSLDALIALQEVGGPLERRRRATGRASRILDALDEMKLELLAGGLTPALVEALARAVRDQRALTDDPRLEGVLDEIETRAAVELAKLEGAKLTEHRVAT